VVDDIDASPLIRTDFSDEEAWKSLVRAAEAVSPDGFRAYFRITDDRSFDGRSPAELLLIGEGWQDASVLFVADTQALTDDEKPILCIDLTAQPGRAFRCIPAELWGIENNLRIANMDFEEFARCVGPDGVFRGFD
jgi:hypothetical protein